MVDAAPQAHRLVAPGPLRPLSCAVAVLISVGRPSVRAETSATVQETEAASPVGANDQTCFSVGDGDSVIESDGITWSKVPTSFSAYGIDTNNTIAVGEADVALRYQP